MLFAANGAGHHLVPVHSALVSSDVKVTSKTHCGTTGRWTLSIVTKYVFAESAFLSVRAYCTRSSVLIIPIFLNVIFIFTFYFFIFIICRLSASSLPIRHFLLLLLESLSRPSPTIKKYTRVATESLSNTSPTSLTTFVAT